MDLDLPPAEQSCDLSSCTVGFATLSFRDYRYIVDVRFHLAAVL
jgi:hypothetical protein